MTATDFGTSAPEDRADDVLRRVATRGLSPMQVGMLYQALRAGAPGGQSPFDVEQMHLALGETLAVGAFQRAWQWLVARHPVLRTSFAWEAAEPQQLVHAAVAVPIETVDFTGETAESYGERLARLLLADRRRGFDLREPPLLRVTLIRTPGPGTEIVWTFHHILIDARCFPILLRELFLAYDAFNGNLVPALPEPPGRYAEYLDWLATRDPEPARAFFRELLRGKSAPTPLPGAEPAERPLPVAADAEAYGRVVRRREGLPGALRGLAERTGTTVGTVVQGAWALVLARFTGDDDVLFGVTRACRHSVPVGSADDTIGLYINTLPVRVRLTADRTIGDLLESLRAQSLGLRPHEHTSLVDVQGASEIPRGLPLLPTLLMFTNRDLGDELAAGDPARFGAGTVTLYEQPGPALTLIAIAPERDHLELRLLYERARFRPAVVERLAEAVLHALSELAAAGPSEVVRPLEHLDVLPPAERRRLIETWNDTARPFPSELGIHELFEAQADAHPEAMALEMGETRLTYGALDDRANRVAHALIARGMGRGRFVAVCLERGPDLIATLIATVKAGAAYVPLDPKQPAARLARTLEDVSSPLVVTTSAHRHLFAEGPVLLLDALTAEPGADGPEAEAWSRTDRPARTGEPTDACYVIFTSGSTGRPKGVVLSHRAVVNTLDWAIRAMDMGPRDRLLFVNSPGFDLSVFDIFGVLGSGGTVVIASESDLAEPAALGDLLVRGGITVWNSAPAALQRVLGFLPGGTAEAPFRLAMLSGDWIPLALPGAVRAAFPRAEVVSLGGATEAAIWSNVFPIGALDPRWVSIPYGRPIQNCRYHVLDHRLHPVPVGVAGDLYIGGACLADGYLGRPELTAERFIPDPISRRPGERLYKTGDLARYFEDGELELLGRADFQVKIRGFRVEMAEIEAALLAIPGVREALCTAFTDASGEKALAAYVVLTAGPTATATATPPPPAAGATDPEGARTPDSPRTWDAPTLPDGRAMREHLRLSLPEYMLPAQVMVLDALPLSPNGKVDRSALPAPGRAPREAPAAAARDDRERRLVSLWEEVLQRRPIGITDDFFALGGHSLLAVMLMTRIQKELKVRLPLSMLLEHPNIESLARALAPSTTAATAASGAGDGTGNGTGQPARASRHLLTLNGSGTRPPLVLVAGIGGYAFTYRNFPALFGPDQPVLAFQSVGAEDSEPLVDHSIEAMAAIYEDELSRTAARMAALGGPLVLGGFSFGVLPAFELARRLRSHGREVPLLVSFDGFAPGYPRRLPFPERVLAHAREFVRGGSREKRAYLRERAANMRRDLMARLGRASELAPAIPFADPDMTQRMQDLWVMHQQARERYLPRGREPFALLLICPESTERWVATQMDDPLYGWRSFVSGPISLVTVPGHHTALLDGPNQPLIIHAISEHITRFARTGNGSPPGR
jgi:amino acid adenylation domain-containing protein